MPLASTSGRWHHVAARCRACASAARLMPTPSLCCPRSPRSSFSCRRPSACCTRSAPCECPPLLREPSAVPRVMPPASWLHLHRRRRRCRDVRGIRPRRVLASSRPRALGAAAAAACAVGGALHASTSSGSLSKCSARRRRGAGRRGRAPRQRPRKWAALEQRLGLRTARAAGGRRRRGRRAGGGGTGTAATLSGRGGGRPCVAAAPPVLLCASSVLWQLARERAKSRSAPCSCRRVFIWKRAAVGAEWSGLRPR